MQERTKLYFGYDISLYYLTHSQFKEHYHHPIQLTIGINDVFKAKVDGGDWNEYRFLISGSEVPHALELTEIPVIVIMLLPETEAGKAVAEKLLLEKSYVSPSIDPIQSFFPSLKELGQKVQSISKVRQLCQEIFDTLLDGHYEIGYDKALDPRISKAMDIIKQLPKKSISLDDLAKRVHLSSSRFRHLFKEETGNTFRNFLMQIRAHEVLKHAKDEQSLTRIAYETGFTDSAHLSRAFKKIGGINPSTYVNSRKFLEVYTE